MMVLEEMHIKRSIFTKPFFKDRSNVSTRSSPSKSPDISFINAWTTSYVFPAGSPYSWFRVSVSVQKSTLSLPSSYDTGIYPRECPGRSNSGTTRIPRALAYTCRAAMSAWV